MLRGVGGPVVAVEVNVSCPNVEDRSRMFAHHPAATAEAVAASECGLARWAKLSPNVPDLCEIAGAALGAGAEGLTLVNTVLAMVVDPVSRAAVLGAGEGDCRVRPCGRSPCARSPSAERRSRDAGIVGVGGVASGRDAAELLVAGADAVQVGTATFRDPRAPWRVLSGSNVGVAGTALARCTSWWGRCMAESFRSRLLAATAQRGSLCAGIDPTASVLHAWGLPDAAAGAAEFGKRCVEAFAPHVSVVKPNVAFFEQYGAAGICGARDRCSRRRATPGCSRSPTRNGATSRRPTPRTPRAWLDSNSPLAVDAVTVAPYLGARALAAVLRRRRSTRPRGVHRRAQFESRGPRRAAGPRRRRPNPRGGAPRRGGGPGRGSGCGDRTDGRPGPPDPARRVLLPGPGTGDPGRRLARSWQPSTGGMASAPVVVNLSRSLVEAGPDPGALHAATVRARSGDRRPVVPSFGLRRYRRGHASTARTYR